MDNYQQVLLQMEEFGIVLLDKNLPLKTGTPKRVTCGKGGKDWYRLYEFCRDAGGTYIVGIYGTYRHGGDWRKVVVDWKPLSDAERTRMAAERRAERERAEADRRLAAELAAMGAAELLASARREGISPYLQRKLVEGESCRYLPDGTIVIPLMRYDLPVDQRLQAVQRILPSADNRTIFTLLSQADTARQTSQAATDDNDIKFHRVSPERWPQTGYHPDHTALDTPNA